MKRVQVWLENNQLTLNLKKTNYIIFKSEYEIKQEHNTKFLGVMIDEQLTWKNHICEIAKTVGILCKARHFIEKDLLLSPYYPLIYPHLICIGNSVICSDISKLLYIISRAVR